MARPESNHHLERGYRLGDYSLLEQIGHGGEAVVWSAVDNRRQRIVALKIVPIYEDEFNLVSREFERQAYLLASLEHPHILPLYEFASNDHYFYFVTRYSCVGSLAGRLLAGPLPVEDVLRYASQITDALSYLHAQNVIHRDLKPSNILLDGRLSGYLSDFGLAKNLIQATMPLHTGRGTGPYAPYEQHVHFNMVPQSDIFSMGIVIYELLTGDLPWKGEMFLAVEQKQTGSDLPDVREERPELPAGVTTALREMTSFRWQGRPETAQDAFQLLLDAFSELPDDFVAELQRPSSSLSDETLNSKDADYLLNLFLPDWKPEEEDFPARLTHLALMDSAFRHKDDLSPEASHFMLRGAFAHGYRIDPWWQRTDNEETRICTCEQTIRHESDTAVTQALNRLRQEIDQGTSFNLSPDTLSHLIDIAVSARGWALRDDALNVVAQAAPAATRWRPVGISAEGDVHLADLALADKAHARQAAQIIGQIRSETAVQSLLDPQRKVSEETLVQTLSTIREEAGGLPGLVPARFRRRMVAQKIQTQLLEDREGLSVSRTMIGLLVGVAVSLLMLIGYFSIPAVQMQDSLLAPYPVSGIITIVAVDDASLERFGRWDAWPRSLHAQLIDQITAAGAKAIALDFVFDALSEDEDDAQLAEAIEQAGMVVQPVLGQGDGFLDIPGVVRFKEKILPQATFLEPTVALGHTNILHDKDGYVRRLPTVIEVGDERYLSLPLAALQVYLGVPPGVLATGSGALSVGGRQIPVGSSGEMSIYYAGPPTQGEEQTFPMVSYQDVLDGQVPPEMFKDKIVLVGITATSEPDSYLTPVSRGRPMYGVEILANTAESVWSGQFINHPGWPIRVVVLLLLGVLTGLVCVRPWSGLFLSAGLGLVYFGLVMLLFDARGVLLDLLYPFMTIAMTYAIVTAYRFSIETRRRREMMQLFEMNVTPQVAQATITAVKKGEVNLNGQVQEISALTVQLEGHSALTEMMEPTVVMEQLQHIQGVIRDQVLSSEGMVVQQEGEQLLAIFNAPLPQPDHAWRAVQTAFSIRESVQTNQGSLTQLLQQVILCRIGIYTGRAVVGNVGAPPRYAYTALGEAVTIATALAELAEPGEIFLGKPTYDKVADLIMVESLPTTMLQDGSDPLPVFTAVKPL